MHDLEKLLASSGSNATIIELDNFICQLCEWGERPDVLSGPQKDFFLNQQLEREVNNGGFQQYFFNASGSHASATIESLTKIGAISTAELLKSAISQFPDSKVPAGEDERRDLILNLWPDSSNQVWADLDRQFYLYEDDLNELNLAFIRANREHFRSDDA